MDKQPDAVKLLRAIYDRNGVRWKTLCTLFNGSATVYELSDKFGVEQSAMSHHLQVLRRAKLVTGRWVHKERYYRLTDLTGVATLIKALQMLER